MPWTVSDVDKFKKGLTAKQKKQWVKIANSVLADCRKKNGKNCEAKAIKQANGSIKTNSMDKRKRVLDIYFAATENYTIRTETFNNTDYLVVPVVMMVEGVHVGSHGPVLHLAEELGRYPESWDGMPVTIGHPQADGVYVSANNPNILEDWAVGRIFNTQMVDSALRAEAWLEEESLERVSEDSLQRIRNGEVLEVSVGVFSDEERTPGTWNTERYNAIARNHRPNHLALLPDEVGACSITDGCGIRVNKKGETKVAEKEKFVLNKETRSQVLKELNHLGFFINEVGHNEIREKVAQIVYGFDDGGLDNYVDDVYNDYFVYSQFNNRVEPRTKKLYKQNYVIGEDNNIVLNGEPVQVKREISYSVVPSVNSEEREVTRRVIQKNNKKSMCTECVKKLADGLIANKSTAWSEDDREYLETQSEAQLEKMTPSVVKEPEVHTAKPTREEIIAVLNEKPMTSEEFLGLAPKEVRSQMEEGLELRTNQTNTMISEILANTEDVYTEDELKGKELKDLQKLHKIVMKDSGETVYAVNGGIGGKTQVETNSRGPKTKMLPRGVKQAESN